MSSHAEHPKINYTRIWIILMALLVVSIIGPLFGVLSVTLITAFGIALVKGWMVATYFMHLNVEKKYIWWLLLISLLFIVTLFVGMFPDITMDGGTNWKNCMVDSTCVPQRL